LPRGPYLYLTIAVGIFPTPISSFQTVVEIIIQHILATRRLISAYLVFCLAITSINLTAPVASTGSENRSTLWQLSGGHFGYLADSDQPKNDGRMSGPV
jgi:hypothetical protein